jgi:hypothetical protein
MFGEMQNGGMFHGYTNALTNPTLRKIECVG